MPKPSMNAIIEAYAAKHPGRVRNADGKPLNATLTGPEAAAPKATQARAHPRRVPGTMNKTEAEYADYLEGQKHLGHIQDYRFEAMKLRLADKTFYTPDFAVIDWAGMITFHEVKGFWEDDARVKIKVAAEQHWWFRFFAVSKIAKKNGGGWKTESF